MIKKLINKVRLGSKAKGKSKVRGKSKKTRFSHDRLFKLFYSDPRLTVELLYLIFSKEELKEYDLSRLKIEKDTFGDQKADLVFSLPLKATPRMKLKFFILLEHKSFYDEKLFNQLLAYQFAMRKHIIKQVGYPQPIIPIVFYHGREPFKWKKTLQEEDFKEFFSKIPVESRKSMLNYKPKIINTHNPEVQKIYKDKKLRGYGVIKLLSDIWSIRSKPTALKIKDVRVEFEDMLRGATEEERKEIKLRFSGYVEENAKLDSKIWEEVEVLLKKEGITNKEGGKTMESAKEIIKQQGIEEGIERGIYKGRSEERQAVILNMLKEKADLSFISKVTGLSEEEIKKLKNGK